MVKKKKEKFITQEQKGMFAKSRKMTKIQSPFEVLLLLRLFIALNQSLISSLFVTSFQFQTLVPLTTTNKRCNKCGALIAPTNNKARPKYDISDWNRRAPSKSIGLEATKASPTTKIEDTSNSLIRTDVLVLGSGPAARSIASLLSNSNAGSFDVTLADKHFDRSWAPNYGVWQDEWEAVSKMFQNKANINLLDCINRKWSKTECFFGGSYDIPTAERFRIPRPYWRVDRDALRKTLTPSGEGGLSKLSTPYRVIRENHIVERTLAPNLHTPSNAIIHDEFGTTVTLSEGTVVRAKLVIDCTGHESKIVQKEARVTDRPGFQIAYGAMLNVEDKKDSDFIGPYNKEVMTLFDYRTDHFKEESSEWLKAQQAPTFNYVMPIKDGKVFVEETSLVARPGVSFMECKERLSTRLEYHGIQILDIEEEEFCYIPMGGALPAKDQRVIGFGGAAATVHPSTGYHICRMMASANNVATAIERELSLQNSSSSLKKFNPDIASANIYNAIWYPSNVRQRQFAVFGGEFLMKQKVDGLRGFFDGFFRLPIEMWSGFLAGWPGLPNNEKHETWLARMVFGLTFVSKLPLQVALDMLSSIIAYSVTEPGFPLLQSVTPFFGEPKSYVTTEKPKLMGDVAAKAEARKMLKESTVEKYIPVPLEE